MSIEQRVTLYIHPDKGPIASMQLDMLDVEISIIHSDVNSNRDDARVHEIIARIRSQFPSVQPEAKLQELRWLISRLAHVSIYDGIVLRLPGAIDGPPPPKSYTIEDVQRLSQDASKLTMQLEGVKQQHDKVQALVASLQSENSQLRSAHQVQQEQIIQLRGDLQDAEVRAHNANMDAKKYREQATRLEQEKAGLQVELDRAKQDRQVPSNLQKEVASLRQQLTDAKMVEQQLRESLKKGEQENKELRQKVRHFVEQVAPAKADEAKDPWLD